MEATARTLENDKTHFATLAIGATAKSLLRNPESGLNLLSDEYIVNDTIRELENM
jgi:hypothetical protein